MLISLHLQARSRHLQCTAGTGTLSLHSGESTISFTVTSSQAEDISAALQAVLTVFAEKQKAERPKRYKSMEYKHKGTRKHALPGVKLSRAGRAGL